MSKDTKNKGISRIDSGSTHGWFVRGYKNGKTYSKLFSDKKWGGKRKAMDAAREYRNNLLKELELIPAKPRGRRIVFRDSRNTTGVLGVCRTAKKSANGAINECYSVSWRPEPGVQNAPRSRSASMARRRRSSLRWRTGARCCGRFMARASSGR